jgi:hypothetical protein
MDLQGCLPFGGSWRPCVSLPFSARGHLHSLAHNLVLTITSPSFSASVVTRLPFLVFFVLFWFWPKLYCFPHINTMITLESHMSSPISKALTWAQLQSLFCIQSNIHKSQRLGHYGGGRGYLSAYQRVLYPLRALSPMSVPQDLRHNLPGLVQNENTGPQSKNVKYFKTVAAEY